MGEQGECDASMLAAVHPHRASPSRAGLSHIREEAEEEVIFPSGAFDCPAFGFKPPALAGKGFSQRLA